MSRPVDLNAMSHFVAVRALLSPTVNAGIDALDPVNIRILVIDVSRCSIPTAVTALTRLFGGKEAA